MKKLFILVMLLFVIDIKAFKESKKFFDCLKEAQQLAMKSMFEGDVCGAIHDIVEAFHENRYQEYNEYLYQVGFEALGDVVEHLKSHEDSKDVVDKVVIARNILKNAINPKVNLAHKTKELCKSVMHNKVISFQQICPFVSRERRCLEEEIISNKRILAYKSLYKST